MKRINVGKLITGKRVLYNKSILINSGKITGIEDCEEENELIAIPGFIDMHNHGGYGLDYMSEKIEDFEYLQKCQAKEGITSMLATIGTVKKNLIEKAIRNIENYISNNNKNGAKILGIHMEGPFLSPNRLGVMNKDLLLDIDLELMDYWINLSKNNIKMMTLAPELEGSKELIELLVKNKIIASAGHSDANSEEISNAIGYGLTQVTHMFNAMRPLHHRELGILGESLTNDYLYSAMAGCDEYSIDPAIWKMAFKIKTSNKMILTTDAMILKGLPNGKYKHMGKEIQMKDGFVYTNYHGESRLPGKPMTFIQSIKNVMKNTGADLVDIVRMSSVNPAIRLNIDDHKGYLECNYDADINILDKNYNLIETYVEGNLQ